MESAKATSAPAKHLVKSLKCKGCKWQGKSLRGHLKRAETPCEELYDMEVLEREAKDAHRQRVAEWVMRNKEKIAERKAITRRVKSFATLKLKEEASPQDPLTVVVKKEDEKVECVECGNSYSSQVSLNRHKAADHLGLSYECEECPAMFARDGALEYHNSTQFLSNIKVVPINCVLWLI